MQINFIQGANFSSAPGWVTTVMNQVASTYDTLFRNNITINVTLNWVPLGDTHQGGILAENNLSGGPAGVTSSFATVSAALGSHATNAIQNEAYANLPSGVSDVYVAPAQAMVLGLESPQAVDIYVDLASDGWWTPDGGIFDPFAAIAHEITEAAMGRMSFHPSATPNIMDLFRYSGSGAHDLTTGTSSSNTTAYFSIDNGGTVLGTWNNKPKNGDYGDWTAGPIPNDAYGSQDGAAVAPISEVDLELMNVLGWNVDAVTSGVTSVVSGGQTYSGYTVMNGGVLTVQSAGTASNTWYTDAQQYNDGTIAPGSSGGADAVGLIQSGGSEVSATIDGGGLEWVDAGGEADYSTVLAYGGIIDLGFTSGAILSANGGEDVETGGSAFYTSVNSGGTLSLHSGSLGFANHIFNGGVEVVLGSAILDTVSAGGTQTVSSGGVDEASFVSGVQHVYGVASGEIVAGIAAYQYVESGGSAVSAVMSALGFQIVSSGGVAIGATLGPSGVQFVQAGASATGTVLASAGSAFISAGGVGDEFTVSSGGVLSGPGVLIGYNSVAGSVQGVTLGDTVHVDTLELTSGGAAIGVTVIDSADSLRIDAGASATGTVVSTTANDAVYGVGVGAVISSGGVEYVYSGGVASGTTVLNGGVDSAASGGALVSAVVSAGGSAILQAGATGDGLAISAGGVLDGPGVLTHHNTAAGLVSGVTVGDPYNVDTLEMLSGGVASNVTVIIADDSLRIDSGATATGTVVSSGGYDIVYGSAAGTQVSAGGTEYVSSGGVTLAASVYAGGTLNVASGGLVSAASVAAGGTLLGQGVLLGFNGVAGAVDGVTVGRTGAVGARLLLYSGAVASGVTVAASGTEAVASGATVSGSTVLSGGLQALNAGGTDVAVTISSGATLELVSAVIPSGQTLTAGPQPAETLSGATLISGARLELSGATVLSGGAVLVSGGLVVATTISSGGAVTVRAGGEAAVTVVSSGGTETVSSGGQSLGAQVLAGGRQAVLAKALASGTVISSGGTQTVAAGGVASGVVVQSGGVQVLAAGGVESGVTVSSGGVLELAAPVISSGKTITAGPQPAETLSGATLLNGAIVELSGAKVLSGGAVVVSGGLAIGTAVSSGGVETVSTGGKSVGAKVLNGGREIVSANGLASGAAIASGGAAYVLSGGSASAVIVSSGGTLIISSGGTTSGLTLSAGGVVVDDGSILIAGAHALAGTLSGGGSLVKTGAGTLTLSGASPTFGGQAVISSGVLELAGANALGGGSVVFNPAAAATLQIDAAEAPAAGGTFVDPLSNFSGPNDLVDLRSIPFVAGATAVVSGGHTLVLTDGGKVYRFNLAGSVGASFPVISDGKGGTLIDPKATAFSHSVAGFVGSAIGPAQISSAFASSFVPIVHFGSAAGA